MGSNDVRIPFNFKIDSAGKFYYTSSAVDTQVAALSMNVWYEFEFMLDAGVGTSSVKVTNLTPGSSEVYQENVLRDNTVDTTVKNIRFSNGASARQPSYAYLDDFKMVVIP